MNLMLIFVNFGIRLGIDSYSLQEGRELSLFNKGLNSYNSFIKNEKNMLRMACGSEEDFNEIQNNEQFFFKIILISDKDRVDNLKEDLEKDTMRIFEEASKIITTLINQLSLQCLGYYKVEGDYFFSEFNTKDILNEEDLKTEELEYFSSTVGKIKSHRLKKANLIILITSKDNDELEGLSYIGGSSSLKENFGIISVSNRDSYFYKGKVLVHEILHSLGAQHEKEENSIMNESFTSTDSQEKIEIGHKTLKNIKIFLNEHKKKFKKH